MKTLKLIVLMLLTANFVTAQTNNTYSAPEAPLGDRNAIIGVDAGINNTGGGNVYMGYQAGKNATNSNRSIFIGEGAWKCNR